MDRKDFIISMLALGFAALPVPALSRKRKETDQSSLRLLRHATLSVKLGKHTLLIDPMLSMQGAMPPVPNAGVDKRIPMCELPLDSDGLNALIEETDIIIVTHLHRDHWDHKAQELIPRHKMLLCQPGDVATLKAQGFTNATGFDTFHWKDLTFHRTGGQHGTGEIGIKMGHVSGVVITSPHTTLYIAGDTIWCEEVEQAIGKFRPDHIVVNAGAAQFLTGGAITMTKEDIKATLLHAGKAHVIAVHMDTINHCLLTRKDLGAYASAEGFGKALTIPEDGETIVL